MYLLCCTEMLNIWPTRLEEKKTYQIYYIAEPFRLMHRVLKFIKGFFLMQKNDVKLIMTTGQ